MPGGLSPRSRAGCPPPAPSRPRAPAWPPLPVSPDVVPALDRLRSRARLAVVSNGDPDQIEAALSRAGIRSYFDPVVSAAEVRSFKPARAVYLRAVERLAA